MTDCQFVDAQLAAFNRHDLDAFLACYGDDAVLAALTTGPIAAGAEAWRAYYTDLFARCPAVRAELLQRTVVGDIVADLEVIHGASPEPRQSLVLYRVAADGRIDAVWFAR